MLTEGCPHIREGDTPLHPAGGPPPLAGEDLNSKQLAELPPPGALRDIAAGAVLAAAALMLLSWAYARAEAQALVTVEYTAFVWASLMGWQWFGEAVTWSTVAGVVLIVAGCWIVARKPIEQTGL